MKARIDLAALERDQIASGLNPLIVRQTIRRHTPEAEQIRHIRQWRDQGLRESEIARRLMDRYGFSRSTAYRRFSAALY